MAAQHPTPDQMDTLTAMAGDVMASVASPLAIRTARDATRALVGVAGWVSRKTSLPVMRRAMGTLALYAPAWDPISPLRALPVVNGYCDEHVVLIASVASTLVPFFGASSIRAAMAFWATEDDAAVWQAIAA